MDFDLGKFIAVVLGESNYGKSTFVHSEIIPRFKRVIFVDSQNQVPVPSTIKDAYFNSGVRFCRDFASTLNAFEEFYDRESFRIVCKYPDDSEEHIFDMVSEIGNVTLIVEEIDLFAKSNTKNSLYKIITKGRHRNIQLVGIAQRPGNVSTELKSQCNFLITFKQTYKIDIDFFSGYNANARNVLPGLKVGEFITIIGGKETWEQIKKIDKKYRPLLNVKKYKSVCVNLSR